MVDLMIILFHQKLDKCYWGYELVQMMCCDLFFCLYKNKLLFFQQTRIILNSKRHYHNGGCKEKIAEYYIANKDVFRENAKNKY